MTLTALLTNLKPRARQRVLAGTLSAHVLHDGYTDLLYVMLPVWQAELALSLAQVGFLKTAYSAVMASLQVPAGFLAERLGERALLALGTAVAGLGYMLAGWSGGFFGLAACLAVGGAGSSVQHPLSSSITARTFEGPQLRTALSTYNFSGDVGKMLFPAATAWLITTWSWRPATTVIGAVGFLVAIVLLLLLPAGVHHRDCVAAGDTNSDSGNALPPGIGRRGFLALASIGIIDSATRMGFLILLPFLLTQKGASLPMVGTSLTLVFAGGAAGKFVCGIIAARLGIIRTVVLTECATALGIIALLPFSIGAAMLLLPAIGVALNGTSSVLYGTVAELVPAERRARAFGVFYTCTIGAGAISPSIYGLLSDLAGVRITLAVVGLVVLAVLPLTLALRPALRLLAVRAFDG
jgi:FSR family fosmidomycin resistance protein-like MFS transporter